MTCLGIQISRTAIIMTASLLLKLRHSDGSSQPVPPSVHAIKYYALCTIVYIQFKSGKLIIFCLIGFIVFEIHKTFFQLLMTLDCGETAFLCIHLWTRTRKDLTEIIYSIYLLSRETAYFKNTLAKSSPKECGRE